METLYAYLAGAIDIDGRILIERLHGSRRRSDGRQVSYYKATIKLSEFFFDVARPFTSNFSGSPFAIRSQEPKASRVAHVGGRRSKRARTDGPFVALLRIQTPTSGTGTYAHHMIKHERAGSGRPLTDEQEQARHRLFEEARLLNDSRPRRMYR